MGPKKKILICADIPSHYSIIEMYIGKNVAMAKTSLSQFFVLLQSQMGIFLPFDPIKKGARGLPSAAGIDHDPFVGERCL